MPMEDGLKVIGKMEKGFKLITKARNFQLHLNGDTLRDNPTYSIFQNILRERYYKGKQFKFLNLTKAGIAKTLHSSR